MDNANLGELNRFLADHEQRIIKLEKAIEQVKAERANEVSIERKDTDCHASCNECGIELDEVMGYCCPRTNCPVGLGPAMS